MRMIDLDELLKFPIRRDHCDKENANPNFIDGIETVFEYAENLPTVRWIPVTERLPENDGYYLVNARYGITIMEFNMGNERYMEKPSFVSELLGRCNADITHWMPLPNPPKDGE